MSGALAVVRALGVQMGRSVMSEAVPTIMSLLKSEMMRTALYGVRELEQKARWLKITIINLTDDQTLLMEDNWFDSGRFWNQGSISSIEPKSAITLGVCSRDTSIMTGVSGGLGFQAKDKRNGMKIRGPGDSDWWICMFSNPWIGSVKFLTRWKSYGIKPLFDEMQSDSLIRDQRCGCFLYDNNHIVFVWKSPYTPW